jgi:hypothetical protein
MKSEGSLPPRNDPCSHATVAEMGLIMASASLADEAHGSCGLFSLGTSQKRRGRWSRGNAARAHPPASVFPISLHFESCFSGATPPLLCSLNTLLARLSCLTKEHFCTS